MEFSFDFKITEENKKVIEEILKQKGVKHYVLETKDKEKLDLVEYKDYKELEEELDKYKSLYENEKEEHKKEIKEYQEELEKEKQELIDYLKDLIENKYTNGKVVWFDSEYARIYGELCTMAGAGDTRLSLVPLSEIKEILSKIEKSDK